MTSFHQDNSIEALGLSSNSRRWLEAAGLRTVLQVAVAWYNGEVQAQWASHPEANVRMLADIRERLESYLLGHPEVAKLACKIGSSGAPTSAPRPQNLRHTTDQSSKSREVSTVRKIERPSAVKAKPSTSLDSLHLSKYSYLALEAQGICTVEQLMVMPEETLLRLTALSAKQRKEIRSRLQAFLDSPSAPWTSLQALGLSVRTQRALMRAGIRTVEHLAAMPDSAIWDVPNIGEKSLNEIKTKLEAYCENVPDTGLPFADGSWTAEASDQVTADEERTHEGSLHSAAAVDEPIEVLHLSVRSYNRLKSAGMHRVSQLLSASDEELLAIKHLGTSSLKDIKERLATYQAGIHEPIATAVVTKDQVSPDRLDSSIQFPVEFRGLSDYASEALHRAGCKTVSDVAAIVERGFHSARKYMDQASWTEIKERLDAFFAHHPELSPPASLEVLQLSVRSHNALRRHGIQTVDELAQLSKEEIWDVRNVGAKAVAEITEKLSSYLKIHPECAQPWPLAHRPAAAAPQPPKLTMAGPHRLAAARVRGIPLDDISVERLGLSTAYRNTLRQHNIRTVGELAQQPRDMWEREVRISRQLEWYLDWLIEKDVTVWASEVAAQGISPLLRRELAEVSLENLVRKWFATLRSREAEIIYLRYGLDGEVLTLEEVGQLLGVTRERVRQIQNRALKKLRQGYNIASIRPLKVLLLHLIGQAGGMIDERQVETALHDELTIGHIEPVGVARLVFDTTNAVEWQAKIQAWGIVGLPLDEVEDVQKYLIAVLERAYAPLAFETVISRFKATGYCRGKGRELDEPFVAACLNAHPKIEVDENGLCSLKKWGKTRLDEIILAMRQIGKPAHYSLIAEKANALLHPEQRTSVRNIQALLERQSTVFISLGRGKYWLRDHVLAAADICSEADFGDLFGAQLARWQEELDNQQGNSEHNTHAEVDRIRGAGLDFFAP